VAPELPEQVAQGTAEPRKVVVEAAKIAKKDPEAAAEILAGKRSLQAERAKARRAERIEEIKTTSGTADQQPGEGKLYQVILADPPWRYEHVRTESRAVENQYPTMTIEEIAGLEVPAGDDAILYLWATAPKLADAFEVVGSWGFIYRTCLVWVKDRIGMGYYARGRHELILIATRGKMPVPEAGNRPDSVIEAPRQEHSRKPDKVYELIERCYPELDKIELFARQPREGWARWGYEA
jgi:N6-adenosine-specific RNA methylase IME4